MEATELMELTVQLVQMVLLVTMELTVQLVQTVTMVLMVQMELLV